MCCSKSQDSQLESQSLTFTQFESEQIMSKTLCFSFKSTEELKLDR
jgi:hypothetical protein